jgi:predicted nuclease with RNAse H fold
VTAPLRACVGVDVGGPRKGFDVAVLGAPDRVRLHRTRDVDEVVRRAIGARVVGVDAPAAWAPAGQASRPDERAFARAGICGIRYTPDEATARARDDGYLDWVWQGQALYAALEAVGVPTVEVFPTAAWTRWLGPRGGRTRLAWTREGHRRLRRDGLDDDAGPRPSQDAMDATAAALTTRQVVTGSVEWFGALAVPAAGSWPVRR